MEEEQKIVQGITQEKTFKLTYYDYGQPFYGSYRGMRYRLARDPLKNVYGKSKEEKEDAKLTAMVWPEPYSFEFIKEEDIISSEYPYTEEGKSQAIAWLNEQYLKQKDRWAKLYSIYR